MYAPFREASIAASIAAAKLLLGAHERQPALALAVGSLDDARRDRLLERARLRDEGSGEALPLSRLRGHERRGRLVDRVRKPETRRHPGGDADRPVGSRRDDPVDALGAGEAVDRRLVLGRDERPLVRVREARAPTDRDRRRSRRDRARARRAGARSAPAPLLGRGDAVARAQSPPAFLPPGLVLAVPGDRLLEPALEARPRPPAGQPLELVGRADVAVDLAEPLVDEDLLDVRADRRQDQRRPRRARRCRSRSRR